MSTRMQTCSDVPCKCTTAPYLGGGGGGKALHVSFWGWVPPLPPCAAATVPLEEQTGVIYSISSSHCNNDNIKQTGISLKTRKYEREINVKNRDVEKRAIEGHAWNNGHQINCTLINVLDHQVHLGSWKLRNLSTSISKTQRWTEIKEHLNFSISFWYKPEKARSKRDVSNKNNSEDVRTYEGGSNITSINKVRSYEIPLTTVEVCWIAFETLGINSKTCIKCICVKNSSSANVDVHCFWKKFT